VALSAVLTCGNRYYRTLTRSALSGVGGTRQYTASLTAAAAGIRKNPSQKTKREGKIFPETRQRSAD
jgi:hypothetical protein